VTIGNPALKPEHAHNYDVLYEWYLNPLGLVRAGFFYKSLSDPIVTLLSGPKPTTNPPETFFVSQAGNAGLRILSASSSVSSNTSPTFRACCGD
jgi:outer membrane receptor protein involved in Fe transport